MESAKPLDMSPKRHTTATPKVIYMYIYTQAAPECSRTPGGRLKKQKHIPLYHPELHYGLPVWVQCRECNHSGPVCRVLKVLQENQEDT